MQRSGVWRDYAAMYGHEIMDRHRSRWYRSNTHRPVSTEEIENFMKEALNDAR